MTRLLLLFAVLFVCLFFPLVIMFLKTILANNLNLYRRYVFKE